MTEEANKELVQSYLKAFNDRDGDALSGYLAEDVVQHGIHAELEGYEEIVDLLNDHFAAFPDYSGSTEAIVAEDDLVVVRYQADGTHTGKYRNVDPTGLHAEWTGMAIYRVEDGEIAEVWLEEDRLGLFEQLEMFEASEPAHLRL